MPWWHNPRDYIAVNTWINDNYPAIDLCSLLLYHDLCSLLDTKSFIVRSTKRTSFSYFFFFILSIASINPIQDGGLKSLPPTCFFPATSNSNVRISSQNFVTLSFDTFCQAGVKLQGQTLCLCQIIELEPRPSLKKVVFLVKSL